MVTTKSWPQRKAMSIAMLTAISAMAAAPAFASSCDVTSSSSSFTQTSGDCTVESGVSVTGTAGSAAVSVVGGSGTLTNFGSLLGGADGVLLSAGSMATLANESGALISGDTAGVAVGPSGSIGTITNAGTIKNNGGIGAGVINNGTIGLLLNSAGATINGFTGVNNTGLISDLENNGTIGDSVNSQNGLDNSGTITTLNNTGSILINTPMTAALANLSGTIGALTNSGQISGVSNQSEIESIVNVASGTIASVYGVGNFGTGAIGTLTNAGTISSTGTMLQPGAAINNTGTIGSIANSGALIGGEYGEGIWNNSAGSIGSVSNDITGTISGGLYAIENMHTIDSVTNDGLVAANAGAGVQAVYNMLGATITSLTNAGTISATGTLYPTAIGNSGDIGTLTNSGAILTSGATDATTYGISNNGTIGTLTNTGTIAGSLAGAGVSNGPGSTIGTFDNSGTVAAVINYGSISSLDNQVGGTLVTGSVAQSALLNAGTVASLTNEGSVGNANGSSTSGVANSGLISSLDNSGAITGYTAVSNSGTIASFTNEAGGVIAGASNGVSNAFMSNIRTLINVGEITTTGVSGVGVANSGTIGTLTNSGTIQSVAAVPSATGVANHGSITSLNNTGTIGASGSGVGLENDGTIQSVDNHGQLTGVENMFGQATNTYIGSLTNELDGVILGTGVANGAAVYNKTGTIASLVNDGQIGAITGTSSTIGVNNGGLITALTNNGAIGGVTYGVQNNGTMGTLTNAGQIETGTTGIGQMAVENTGNLGLLDNSGTISGQTGVENFSTITSLNNEAAGTVGGNTAILNIGFVGSISNAGNIAGLYEGIQNLGTIGSIDNAGTISSVFNSGRIGTGSTAIVNEVNGSLAVLNNSGVIAGDVTNLSSNALTITGGGTNTFGTFTGAAGAIGNIASQNADLAMATGSVLLNDNVDLGGAHTLNNVGATLQVNSQLTINGNYSQGANATLLLGVADGAVAGGSLTVDSGYGRLVVSGDATIASGSSVGLQKLAAYAFAPGQRFVVVDAGANSNYNDGTLRYSATGFTGSISGEDVVTNGRHDLVLSLSAGSGTGGTSSGGTGTGGTGSTGAGNTGSTGTGSETGSSGSGGDTGSTSTGGGGTGQGATGTGTGGSTGGGGIVQLVPFKPTNPQAVAAFGGLMRYTGSSNAQLLNLYNALDALAYFGSADQVNRAGQQLSPLSQAASASHAAAAPTLDVLSIVGSRTNSLRLADGGTGSGVATGDGMPRIGVWGQAFGGHASQDAEDQVDGYSANYAGVLVGVDTAVAPNWVAGGVFAYSNTAVNNTGATGGDSTRVNSYGFTGYASYSGNPWYVNLSAGITPQHFDTTRVVSFDGFSGAANGSFSGQQYVARAEFGFPLQLAYATVTPEASLTYSYSHQSAYTETGGNGAALSVDAMHDSSVRSSLGAMIERGFSTSYGELVPELSARWIHEFNNSRLISGASYAADATGQTAFTTVGATPISDYADLGLGVTLIRASNLSLTARYEMQVGKGFLSQTGSLRLRQLF